VAVVTMKDRGDLRIPAEIRHRVGLHDGDRLLVEIRGNEVVLTPLPPKVPLDQLRGKYIDRVREHGPLTKEAVADAVVDAATARVGERHDR